MPLPERRMPANLSGAIRSLAQGTIRANLLYEIWRKDKGGNNGKVAAYLSKRYYDYLRGVPNLEVARTLQGDLTAFKTKNKMAVDDKGKLLFHWDEVVLLTEPSKLVIPGVTVRR